MMDKKYLIKVAIAGFALGVVIYFLFGPALGSADAAPRGTGNAALPPAA